MRLLIEAGAVALRFQDRVFRNLQSERIQVDEMWAFIGAKAKNVTPAIRAKNPEAVALYYFSYNFIKIHRSLRTTPAMAAGVTDRLWEVSDLVALLEADERELPRAA